MPRFIGISLAVLVLLLVVAQLALPPLLASRVEGRLTENGGRAEVELSAFPALRLLFSDGDSFEARGSGLDLALDEQADVLDRLDGFGEVDIRLDDLQAGPLELESFELTRGRDEPDYATRVEGRTTPREVAGFLGGQAGGPLGGLFGGLAGATIPEGDTEVPLMVEASVLSRDGQAEAVSASGEVAGLPAGPLAEVVVDAVLAAL